MFKAIESHSHWPHYLCIRIGILHKIHQLKKQRKKQQNYDEAKQKQQRKWEKKEFHKIAYEM